MDVLERLRAQRARRIGELLPHRVDDGATRLRLAPFFKTGSPDAYDHAPERQPASTRQASRHDCLRTGHPEK